MNGRIPACAAPPETGALNRASIAHSQTALVIALGAGALALIAPPLALLALAGLGAHALMRGEAVRIDLAALVGPIVAALIVGAFAGLAGAIGVLFVWRLVADARWSIDQLAARVHRLRRQGLRVLVRVDYDRGQSVPPAGDELALAEYLGYLRRLARDGDGRVAGAAEVQPRGAHRPGPELRRLP